MGARGSFQRENFALARLAARVLPAAMQGSLLSEQAVQDAAISTLVPGRMQVLGDDPLTVVDGAHNPAAVTALVESLPELLDGRPLALVLGVLEDKDAAGMLRALLPLCERGLVHRATEPESALARDAAIAGRPARLRAVHMRVSAGQSVGGGAQLGARSAAPRFWQLDLYIWSEICSLTRASSVWMSCDRAWGARRATRALAGEGIVVNDDGPSVLTMIGAVALIVALVILVFFAAGYGFGRLFL